MSLGGRRTRHRHPKYMTCCCQCERRVSVCVCAYVFPAVLLYLPSNGDPMHVMRGKEMQDRQDIFIPRHTNLPVEGLWRQGSGQEKWCWQTTCVTLIIVCSFSSRLLECQSLTARTASSRSFVSFRDRHRLLKDVYHLPRNLYLWSINDAVVQEILCSTP